VGSSTCARVYRRRLAGPATRPRAPDRRARDGVLWRRVGSVRSARGV